jgi:hypothetical protein
VQLRGGGEKQVSLRIDRDGSDTTHSITTVATITESTYLARIPSCTSTHLDPAGR